MANHLPEFLNSNNTLYKLQFGFRKHFSTRIAIISLVEKINKAISYDKYMLGVFIDFRKADATVNHSILFLFIVPVTKVSINVASYHLTPSTFLSVIYMIDTCISSNNVIKLNL